MTDPKANELEEIRKILDDLYNLPAYRNKLGQNVLPVYPVSLPDVILALIKRKETEARIDELERLYKFAQDKDSISTTTHAWMRLKALKEIKSDES